MEIIITKLIIIYGIRKTKNPEIRRWIKDNGSLKKWIRISKIKKRINLKRIKGISFKIIIRKRTKRKKWKGYKRIKGKRVKRIKRERIKRDGFKKWLVKSLKRKRILLIRIRKKVWISFEDNLRL